MNDAFQFLMISAMYENGGNTTQRLLDGHPELFVYPFESQLGTALVKDPLSALYPVKYRWPVFDLEATAAADYAAIIDEECKVRARTPHVSKFRDAAFSFSDDRRRDLYRAEIERSGRSRANNIAAFFTSTFAAWENVQRSGAERMYVGYSPIVVVDAEKILADFPRGHILHVVRNPWSAYADTKKRPVPMSLPNYMLGWTINQFHARLFSRRHPDRVHVLRLEDILGNPRRTLGDLCRKLGLRDSASLEQVSWNGQPLAEVYPWGTIRKATAEANRQTALELSADEHSAIAEHAWPYLDDFDYRTFLK